jgi:Asp-tRNA(Asn)/Glu-tRNA(Gln) amidotransferase A subunit family amidase
MNLAKERDLQLKEAKNSGTVDQLGAFFGVPVSIKDQICEEGESVTVGSTWMAAHFKADKDAAVVSFLKS